MKCKSSESISDEEVDIFIIEGRIELQNDLILPELNAV